MTEPTQADPATQAAKQICREYELNYETHVHFSDIIRATYAPLQKRAEAADMYRNALQMAVHAAVTLGMTEEDAEEYYKILDNK